MGNVHNGKKKTEKNLYWLIKSWRSIMMKSIDSYGECTDWEKKTEQNLYRLIKNYRTMVCFAAKCFGLMWVLCKHLQNMFAMHQHHSNPVITIVQFDSGGFYNAQTQYKLHGTEDYKSHSESLN